MMNAGYEPDRGANVRAWAKELIDLIPDGKIMSVVGFLEGAALVSEESDPFYSDENMNRLLRAKAQIKSGGGTEHTNAVLITVTNKMSPSDEGAGRRKL